jgi:AcrR family transcriptional regulator
MLNSITTVVAERGYVDTRVRDVLEHAGVSRRTFYEHFANREECFFAAYNAVRDDVLVVLADRTANAGWQVGVEQALRDVLAYFASWPARAHLLLIEIHSAGPEGTRRNEDTMEQMAGRLAGCQAWTPEPLDGLSRAEGAQALVGAVHRVVSMRLLRHRPQTLPQLAPALTVLLRRASATEGNGNTS